MRRLFGALAGLLFATMAWAGGTPASAPASYNLPMHLGPVANGKLAQGYGATPNKSIMSRSDHVAAQTLTSFQLVFESTHFVAPTTLSNPASAETANGAATSITASVEYPAGTFTQVTFSSATTGSIPDAGYVVSDTITLNIPRGQTFWVRNLQNNTVGVAIDGTCSAANGSGSNFSTTANSQTDLTMSGTVPANGACIAPTAIVGQTTLPSVCLVGDSRVAGLNDTPTDGLPDVGILARTFGASGLPYIDLGVSGERAIDFIDKHAARAAIINAYCPQGVISDYAINDIIQVPVTAAQAISNQQTIRGYFSGVPFFITTLDPVTTSSDGWLTVLNQTVTNTVPSGASQGINDTRVAYNTSIRSGAPSGISGVFDTAILTESTLNSGKWLAGGTIDGVHAGPIGAALVRDKGAIDLSKFRDSTGQAPLAPGQIQLGDLGASARALQNFDGPLLTRQLPGSVCLVTGCAFTGNSSITGIFTINGASGTVLEFRDQTTPANKTWIWRNNAQLVFYDVVTGKLMSYSAGLLTIPQLSVAGSEVHGYACKTASFTADGTVHNVIFAGTCPTNAAPAFGALTANVTETLPVCSSTGLAYGLKKVEASSFTVTLTAATTNASTGVADTIDGSATVVLSTKNAQVNVQCDGFGHWMQGFY